MRRPERLVPAVVVLVLIVSPPASARAPAAGWTVLFNGRDLSGWETWLGIPHASLSGLELPRDAEGQYTAPVGLDVDPRRVFTVVQVDGAPAIRISGEVFGVLARREEHDDFHLRLEFKWGEKKWPPRTDVVRDSGILYYAAGPYGVTRNRHWTRSLECQVQEHDTGDFWGVDGTVVDVTGMRRPVEGQPVVFFERGGPRLAVDGTPRRAVKSADHEKPTGSWNTVDVLCLGGTCLHAVNGAVNMVLSNPRHQAEDGTVTPLRKGRLQIQSEGAEVYYRALAVRRLREFPPGYRP